MNVVIDKIKTLIAVYRSLRFPFRILIPAIPVVLLIVLFSTRGKKQTEDVAVLGPIVEKAYGLGTVHSLDTFRFRVGVPTKITKVFVLEGDEVFAGQSLLQLEGMTVVRSPIHGIVSDVGYHEGEVAFQNILAIEVLGVGSKYLIVALDEQILLSIRKGQKALIRFEGKPNEVVQGKVQGTFSHGGQFYARIEAASFPEGVLPGMTADVAIEVGKRDSAILVPRKYEKKQKILIFRNGKSVAVPFVPGLKSEQFIEVKEGDIQAGDKLAEVP
ncbi:biotin/lipoyl-containing protein [Leptospira kmetyi]|uniref:Secretion protein HlyD n=1 Tax=Leptospira kmetyi TaxID=408139 RepID=A0A2M9XU30_9LEPT|nr:biotin/lipoyl-containing protein [Leptospira kmetyi]AYV54898.1 secretion protein HlyD [Leptospira kmetyi]EQA55185.1 biotin-requiring enzyme [Leptospira kmetyi serovar Malaysia str. Bejo-Iso9]PJZ30012.1 secretion protein HlyD [Leptospira kmetyi]PJZ42814.1 secretion protein HlyD [Leptospira kmetyi]TGK13447.1 secretion protein HlyD [Leptospira kmetyi]